MIQFHKRYNKRHKVIKLHKMKYSFLYPPGTPGMPLDACTFKMLFENPIK